MKPIAVVSVAALLALAACGHESKPSQPSLARPSAPPVSVQVAAAKREPRSQGEEVVGTVRARTVTLVSSSVMGTLRELRVAVGSRVRAGEVIARLSAGEIEAKAEQARARLAQAETNLRRAEELKARDALPSSSYDAALSERRVAQAALSEAQVMTGYTVIRAPLAGVVTEKRADVGDLALPGRPLLVIENADALRLEASLPEASASSVTVGQKLPVRIDALGRELVASVSEISPTADPVSRGVAIKLDLPEDPALRPGMFGRLVLLTLDETVLTVPTHALVRHGQLETVFVARDGKASLRLVRSGRRSADTVEIVAGLSDAELVVSSEARELRDGQLIAWK
jgi:RND family efflux transporter MFP subunit